MAIGAALNPSSVSNKSKIEPKKGLLNFLEKEKQEHSGVRLVEIVKRGDI
jgi:hypothetical protein